VIEQFHFLRPWWLLLLAAPLFVFFAQRALDRTSSRADGLIAPHLIRFLLVPRGRTRSWRPWHFTAAAMILGAIALAGPAWRYEVTPFSRDESPLVIALELSETMDAVDVEPTRLERGKQKIRELLDLRSHARTAIIAYAGTAHVVLPLTEDPGVGTLYLDALATSLMPKSGNNPAAVIPLARELLGKSTVPGSLLLVTDGIPREQIAALADFTSGNDGLMILGIGTDAGGPIRTGENQYLMRGGRPATAAFDADSLRQAAREADAYVGTVTIDSTDVNRLLRRAHTQLERTADASGTARWKDEGWTLVPVIALLTLLSFRRGWTMQWATVVLLVMWPAAKTNAQASGQPAAQGAQNVEASGGRAIQPRVRRQWRFVDLWLTHDQQGRYYFDRGDFKTAAERFDDPEWKGSACYRAADYACAVDQFVRVHSAAASYDLGNAYAHLKRWSDAADSFRAALAAQPDFPAARQNLDLVLDLIHRIEQAEKDKEQEQGINMKPDEVKEDDQTKKGKAALMKQQRPETPTDVWLRGLQMSPAAFLKTKFAIQAGTAKTPAAPGTRQP
jgi:Ca-activated chloride channel family protein